MVLDQSGPALEKYLGKNLRPSALVNWKSRWRKLFQFTARQRSPPGGRQKGASLRFPSYTESKSSFIRRRGPRALSPVQRLCSAPCRRLWTRIRPRLQLLHQLRVWAPVTWSRPRGGPPMPPCLPAPSPQPHLRPTMEPLARDPHAERGDPRRVGGRGGLARARILGVAGLAGVSPEPHPAPQLRN
jgi:hypothetical protein